jgi:two-component system phosphate regulon sensor histidine kinase PhoR
LAKQFRRCAARSAVIAVAAVLTTFFCVVGGLSWRWALAGLIAALLWAALWPLQQRQSSLSTPGDADRAADRRIESAELPIWRRMLDALTDPALVLDADGNVLAANAPMASMLPAASGRHIAQVERAPELMAAVEQAGRAARPASFELHATVPFNRYVTGIAAPLSGPGPRPGAPAMLVLLRDRTEVASLAQMRADFVANASHELRTPLASLKGFVETLQDSAKDDPAAREKFLGIMQEQALRMSRLIEDLLSLSHIEMREHVAPTARAGLGEIVGEVAKGLGPIAEAAGIVISVETGAAPAIAIGDRDELVQVVENLMQNAIKYGRRGGRVEVSLRRQDSSIALSVSDDGIGIAREHLPRLTERFYRVSAKESRERGGTGLGLAIVKHIVNRHRGELRIASELGKGSTFTVLLPAADSAPAV